jgi:hypothetical protein
MRSLTTEKPTEATAPRPSAATICRTKNWRYPLEIPEPASPTAHSVVPSMSSGLRLLRSPV